MTSIPQCTYCIYFDINKLSCSQFKDIPKDIINGKNTCENHKERR